jgi:hypothetical protein
MAEAPRPSQPAPDPLSAGDYPEKRGAIVGAKAPSRVLCQLEKGWDSLHFVFVGEDGEENAVH